ncbi:MAG: hypothetical protein EG828_10310 [Deltaproteobacteria bacterium]|nr:hypothetical protein [Deltaproteobacteria bacterium]
MRNSIHEAATNAFGTARWYESGRGILKRDEIKKVDKAKNDLTREGKQPDPGRVVAALTFGFWAKGLFKTCYEVSIWHRIINNVFPGVPRSQRTRRNIATELDALWNLRNRVFHHEPIWHFPDLDVKHAKIIDMINRINPPMLHLVSICDNFPDIYSRCPAYHVTLMENKLDEIGLSV